jgi:hypothetical protein
MTLFISLTFLFITMIMISYSNKMNIKDYLQIRFDDNHAWEPDHFYSFGFGTRLGTNKFLRTLIQL